MTTQAVAVGFAANLAAVLVSSPLHHAGHRAGWVFGTEKWASFLVRCRFSLCRQVFLVKAAFIQIKRQDYHKENPDSESAALDSILQERDVEVNQQTEPFAGQFQVGEKLGFE